MRWRLILSFVLIVVISVVSVAIIARRSTGFELRAYMFHGGMAGVENLTTVLEDYYRTHNTWQGAEGIFNSPPMGPFWGSGMMHNMVNQHLRLADITGNLLYDSASLSPQGILSALDLQWAIPLRVNRQVVGYLLLERGTPYTLTDEQYLLQRLDRIALTAGVIAGSISLLLALILAYRLLRPVQALKLAADRLAQGDLYQRVTIEGHDELATLGQAFNNMATSLQKAEDIRRAMTADIAHELRTPLSVQRAHLEALQDGIYPLTMDNLTPILEQNQMLSRLVEDLRTLALAEDGKLTLECTPTDLTALSERILERFKTQASARQIELLLKSSLTSNNPTTLLNIDPLRMEQIITNLLTNALRYTPDGGRVSLEVTYQTSTTTLTVQDSGPGIPDEALPYIFERFYRADRSRSRIEGGSGLGLAIARQLAQAHGGDLTAANHPKCGAIFTLTLPLTDQPR